MYYKLLENGKLDDKNTKSEYERGFVDCWNKFVYPLEDRDFQAVKKNFPEIIY